MEMPEDLLDGVELAVDTRPEDMLRDIRQQQRQDDWCKAHIAYLEKGTLPNSKTEHAKRLRAEILATSPYFHLQDGLLHHLHHRKSARKRQGTDLQVVIPDSLKKAVLYASHNGLEGGHLGAHKTYERMQSR